MIVFYFAIVLLLLVKNRNKPVFYLSYVLLLLLFCLNYDNADRAIYESRLINLEKFEGMTEPGYYGLMVLFQKLDLDVQYLYVVVGFCYITSFFYVVNKLTDKPNFPIAFYMVANFFMDVVQLRASCSLIFVVWAFYFLLSDSNVYKRVCLFTLFVFLGSLFHTTALIFLFFALIVKFHGTKLLKIVAVLCLFIYFGQYVLFKYLGTLMSMSEKINQIQSSTKYVGNNMNLIVFLLYALLFAAFSFIFFISKKHKSLAIGMDMCIASLVIVPIIVFSADIRRAYFVIATFLAVVLAKSDVKRNRTICKVLMMIVAFIYFAKITAGRNIDVVFYAVMKNNLLW